jgi:hypothetical protein
LNPKPKFNAESQRCKGLARQSRNPSRGSMFANG